MKIKIICILTISCLFSSIGSNAQSFREIFLGSYLYIGLPTYSSDVCILDTFVYELVNVGQNRPSNTVLYKHSLSGMHMFTEELKPPRYASYGPVSGLKIKAYQNQIYILGSFYDTIRGAISIIYHMDTSGQIIDTVTTASYLGNNNSFIPSDFLISSASEIYWVGYLGTVSHIIKTDLRGNTIWALNYQDPFSDYENYLQYIVEVDSDKFICGGQQLWQPYYNNVDMTQWNNRYNLFFIRKRMKCGILLSIQFSFIMGCMGQQTVFIKLNQPISRK